MVEGLIKPLPVRCRLSDQLGGATRKAARPEKTDGSALKLINAGKILENNKTLAESRVPVGELPGGVITMHVVVRPPSSDKNSEKQLANAPKKNRCSCTIL